MKHPLPEGSIILSLDGERDDNDGEERFTGPNAFGYIDFRESNGDGKWIYHVVFPVNGTWVILHEDDNWSRYVVFSPWQIPEILHTVVQYRRMEHEDTPRLFRGKKLHELGLKIDQLLRL